MARSAMSSARSAVNPTVLAMTHTSALEKDLRSLTAQLPPWARWLYRLFLLWFLPMLRRAEVRLAQQELNKAFADIVDDGQRADRKAAAEAAAAKARQQFPDAQVKVVPMPHQPVDAIEIQHPPDPSDHAQQALGFGTIEIKATYAV